jgi:hypothetical protein
MNDQIGTSARERWVAAHVQWEVRAIVEDAERHYRDDEVTRWVGQKGVR